MCRELTQVEKLVIIPIWVAPQKTSRFDWKLPAFVTQCIGVAFTISSLRNDCSQMKIGEVSISFNNRCSQPVNFEIQQKNKHFRLDKLLMSMDEPIVSASRVSGYYRNLSDNEHVLKMYLKCLAEIEQ